ncbi:hypothetical protein D3C78_1130250 [compost metagenome]
MASKALIVGSKVFPLTTSILISGVNLLYNERTITSKPLNTDKIIINAAVPINTPTIEIADIILIALVDFLENKYRFAKYSARFINQSLPVLN